MLRAACLLALVLFATAPAAGASDPLTQDRKAIAEKVIAAVGDRLPPPGYLDIVFEEPED